MSLGTITTCTFLAWRDDWPLKMGQLGNGALHIADRVGRGGGRADSLASGLLRASQHEEIMAVAAVSLHNYYMSVASQSLIIKQCVFIRSTPLGGHKFLRWRHLVRDIYSLLELFLVLFGGYFFTCPLRPWSSLDYRGHQLYSTWCNAPWA